MSNSVSNFLVSFNIGRQLAASFILVLQLSQIFGLLEIRVLHDVCKSQDLDASLKTLDLKGKNWLKTL